VLAERAFLRGLGGGCLVPIGALGEMSEGRLKLRGCVLPVDGSVRIEGELIGFAEAPEGVGQALAKVLLDQGAGEILKRETGK
jgi:hydroxymethylbilane synthase